MDEEYLEVAIDVFLNSADMVVAEDRSDREVISFSIYFFDLIDLRFYGVCMFTLSEISF